MSADVARVCSNCSDELVDGAQQCASCGGENIERACNACGVILGSGDVTCPSCTPSAASSTDDDRFGPERRRAFDDVSVEESLRDESVWMNLADEYQPVREVRSSPRSTVYQVDDLMRHRTVAIEILAPGRIHDEQHAERFLQEAKALIPAKHRHVHSVYAVRQIDEAFLLVMANLDGAPLSEQMQRQSITSVDMVRTLATQLGAALDHLQARDIVHGDIRPETIWIRENGEAVLTDFAFRADRAEPPCDDATGSPGHAPVPERMWESDQYALGEVLYTLLTGEPPYAPVSTGVPALFLHRDPTPIRDSRADCPADFEALILRMLAVQPSDRWPSLSDALSRLAPVAADSPDVFANVVALWPVAETSTPYIDAQTDVSSIADIEFIEIASPHASAASRAWAPPEHGAPAERSVASSTSVPDVVPPANAVLPTKQQVDLPPLAAAVARTEPTTSAPVFARPVKPAASERHDGAAEVATNSAAGLPTATPAPLSGKPAPVKTTPVPLPAPKKQSRVGPSLGLLLLVGLAAAYVGRDSLPLGRGGAVRTSRPVSTYFASEAQAEMFKAGYGISSPAAADDFSASPQDPKLLIVDGRVSLAPSALAYGQNGWRASTSDMAVHFDVWFDRAPGPHEGGIVFRTMSGEHAFVHLMQSTRSHAAVSIRGADGDALLVAPTAAPAIRAGMNAVDLIIVRHELSLFVNGTAVIVSHKLPSVPSGHVGIFGSASTGVEFDNLAIANLSRR